MKGYVRVSRLGPAAFHPLHHDDEALDQLFEVEHPVLMRSCGGRTDMQRVGQTETKTKTVTRS